MSILEQERLDLKEANPDLYAYIAAMEAVKVLDSAINMASGATTGTGAARRLWAVASNYQRRVHVFQQKG